MHMRFASVVTDVQFNKKGGPHVERQQALVAFEGDPPAGSVKVGTVGGVPVYTAPVESPALAQEEAEAAAAAE